MFQSRLGSIFAADHNSLGVNVSPEKLWSIPDRYIDLVSQLHVQIKLMGNFGLNAGIPWLSDTDGTLCFIYKEGDDNVDYFLPECQAFKDNFESISI